MPTTESWERYWEDKKAWDEKMEKEKPNPADTKAYSEWLMKWSCGSPNKPGYEYANNH